jgi:hypothetical protein
MVRLLIIFVTASVVMSGCGAKGTPTPSTTATSQVLPTPEVTSNLGAVVAKLFYASDGTPSRSQIFFVVPLNSVNGADGQPVGLLAGLDPTTAQRGQSDNNGAVVISRVPPGRYGLAMSTPRGYILLQESPSNKEILFDVVAGQVNDLGKRNIQIDKNLVEP